MVLLQKILLLIHPQMLLLRQIMLLLHKIMMLLNQIMIMFHKIMNLLRLLLRILPHLPLSPRICGTPSPQKELDSKGGSPKGLTIDRKRNKEIAMVASLNEVANIYKEARKEAKRKNTKMRRFQLQQKIQEVKEQNNLPEDVVINK